MGRQGLPEPVLLDGTPSALSKLWGRTGWRPPEHFRSGRLCYFRLSLLPNCHVPYGASEFSPGKWANASGGATVRSREKQSQGWQLGSLLGTCRLGAGGPACPGASPCTHGPLTSWEPSAASLLSFSRNLCQLIGSPHHKYLQLPAGLPHDHSSYLTPGSSHLRALPLHRHSAQPPTCSKTCSLNQAALLLPGAPSTGQGFTHRCASLSWIHSAQDRAAPLPGKHWSFRGTG